MNVNMELAEIDDLFSENQRITIYRVVQEALTNVGKHSEAGEVAFTVWRDVDAATFTVEDDGKGFDPEEVMQRNENGKGIGLSSMSERVLLMGGTLELTSRTGEGTRIIFTVPVENGEG